MLNLQRDPKKRDTRDPYNEKMPEALGNVYGDSI